jgi:hypothetical protein
MNFLSKAALVLLSCSLTLSAYADPAPRSYAVMSLIGDEISLVAFKPETGSRLADDNRNVQPVKDAVFDTAAIQAANGMIKKVEPGAQTVLMLTQDQGLYKAQNDMFDAAGSNKDNRAFLLSLLKNRPVTHLVLITKHRGEAQFKLVESYIGKGRVGGLGFYIDDSLVTINQKTLNSSRGVLAPFAYVKLRLIDAKTLEVIAEDHVKESTVVGNSSATANGQQTWNILTGPEKIRYLEDLLGDAMTEGVPRLLAK